MPLLAEIIKGSNEKDMLRYYRAFDFQTDPSKQVVLSNLVTQTRGEKVFYALKQMDPGSALSPAVRTALNKVLDQYKGKLEFVELVSRFKVENRAPDLLAQAIQVPDSAVGKESMKALLDWGRLDLVEKVIHEKKNNEVQAIVKTVWPYMYDPKAMNLMERILSDTTQALDNRKLAVRTFGGPWESEDRLILLAKENKIPPDLHVAAAGVFQSAWRSGVKEEGAKYLKLPGSKEGNALPPVAVLVDKSGSVENGKAVFANTCSNCHQVNGQGVNFGPNLSEIGSKLSKEALYTSILFPDQGIGFGFEGYSFKMKDGSEAFGMITSETEDKVEIRYMNTQQTLDPSRIVSRTKLTTSLMPSNLQSLMTEKELVDLVEYLGSLKKKNDAISQK
jgi:putative heme-binding domain-containing protein